MQMGSSRYAFDIDQSDDLVLTSAGQVVLGAVHRKLDRKRDSVDRLRN